ncbi:MAG: hypothetical protein WKF70_01870 [Chitinophagaceae bacterium]
MNNRIKNYEDLLQEQQRLMSLLKTQESFIRVDIAGVKEGLKPFGRAMNVVNKMATRDNTAPVLNFGLEMGIDLLVRRVLLARAGGTFPGKELFVSYPGRRQTTCTNHQG